MLFNSLTFLFVFLPSLLLLYYVVFPKYFRNHLLLLASLIFYAWGGVSYSVILMASLLFNYLFVTQIAKNRNKKLWLWIGMIFNVLLILVFKYIDFFIDNINVVSGLLLTSFTPMPFLHIVLPLGISFFTFQQMSMLWDVYRQEDVCKPKFLNTALYISFFPQLIAGPIVRYNDIIEQLRNRDENIELFREGIQRFVLGLFKKVIIANQMAIVADKIMGIPAVQLNTSTAWLGVLSYSLQIYFDFSGYSDMAIGLGRMFGFRILENFNFPYIATSIKEFWRRWHMSLSSWFKDYVYIPLGGNRRGLYRTYVNLLAVFLLTGFWHGATWSFVFWGVFHGTFLIIERLGWAKILERLPKFFRWIYTIVVVMVAWVFFKIENFLEAWDYVCRMFSFNESAGVDYWLFLNKEYLFLLILAVFSSSTIWVRLLHITKAWRKSYCITFQLLGDILCVLSLLICVLYINSGSYSPFIYFRF